jgi:hypothetical protein
MILDLGSYDLMIPKYVMIILKTYDNISYDIVIKCYMAQCYIII